MSGSTKSGRGGEGAGWSSQQQPDSPQLVCSQDRISWLSTAHAAIETAGDEAAPALVCCWAELLKWHPSLPLFWPALGREARSRRDEWQVKAADVQVANGTAPANLHAQLGQLKDQAPRLTPAIRKVEAAQEQVRHDVRWKIVYAEALSLAALDDPAAPLASIDQFLRDYPDTPRRAEAVVLARSLKNELAQRRTAIERQFVDDLIRAESLPTVSLSDQIDRARRFLAEHRESAARDLVQTRLEMYLQRLDEHDIDRARDYSRQNPTRFAARIEGYQDYLKAHQAGGRYISEAIESKDKVLREWDSYAYRQAFDHAVAHPDDVAEIVRCSRLSPRPLRGPFRRGCPELSRVVGEDLRPQPLPCHPPPRRGRAQGRQVSCRRRP